MQSREKQIVFTVPESFDGVMLKTFLKGRCHISARLLAALKNKENGLTSNGKRLRTIDRVEVGQAITLTLPKEQNTVEPVSLPLHILYEDAYLLLLDKPPGMPVHPTSCGHTHDTLANACSAYMRQKGESYKIRPVNRLDKDTSGLVLVAKDAFCAYALAQRVEKSYLAVAQGVLNGSATIDSCNRIKPGHTIQRETTPDGQHAITHYTALAHKQGHTLLVLRLETGRTHQIRVHMASIGHPLAGDDLYGGNLTYIGRQALHCNTMAFVHPVTQQVCSFASPVPHDMQFIAFSAFRQGKESLG